MEIVKTEKLKTITISNDYGLELTVINYGATIQSLKVLDKNGKKVNVVVGLQNPEDYSKDCYQKHNVYLGCSIGRYAGRISGGSFSIADETFKVPTDNGIHLHGGNGFDKKFWFVDNISEDGTSITLSHKSKHLDQGYPGNLEVFVTYSLNNSQLEISYTATTDRTTIVNLTNHSYFNLDGKSSILDHSLKINNTHHLEVDKKLIPTGKLLESENTRFDVSSKSIINSDHFIGFDDTFVLNKNIDHAAILSSEKTGIQMKVITNQPALVIYTKDRFPEIPLTSAYKEYPAICFEAQNFPDAPNNHHFPSAILQPNEAYKNKTVFSFSLMAL